MIKNLKEINKKIAQWKKLGNEIIKMVKDDIIVGEIVYKNSPEVKEKKPRKKRTKKNFSGNEEIEQKLPDSELPDLDKKKK